MRSHPLFTRRRFLAASLAAAGAGAASWAWLREPAYEGTLLSAFEDGRGDQYVGGVKLRDAQIFGARVPMRAHGCTVDPRNSRRALFFARRPGTHAFELQLDSVRVRSAFVTGAGRHLSGHGLFSADGEHLFVPEHDYENERGLVSVRDARTFKVQAEIDTRGIDPHEIAWMPDGRTLVIANGGILTHPRTFRRKLNITTMDPSLCLVDSHNGEPVEQWRLPDHQLSIRHLAVSDTGVIVAGLQYEGRPEDVPGIVAVYRPGAGFGLLSAPAEEIARFKGYVASVAVSELHDLIVAACPYGQGLACWSLGEQRYLGFIEAGELYGVSRLADGTLIASQRDGRALALEETRPRSQFLNFASAKPIRWDDHWVAVA